MPAYPIPPSHIPTSQTAHFSAAEFFRDSPWLNVPAHRKADILVEPLYPRMGLLGGAPEGNGKVSKLAALAAARKKKEGEKTPAGEIPTATTLSTESTPETPSAEAKGSPLSLRERLAGSGKPQRSSQSLSTFRSPGKRTPSPSHLQKPSSETRKPQAPAQTAPGKPVKEDLEDHHQEKEPEVNIRAPPSSFASIIVGDSTRPMMTEPSHLHSNTVDLMKIYGQNLTEPFDFAGPSPDDVVINAQSSAKGLAFRTKM